MSGESLDGEGSAGDQSITDEQPEPVLRSSSRSRRAPARLGYTKRPNSVKEDSDSDNFGFGAGSEDDDGSEASVDGSSPDEDDNTEEENETSVTRRSPKRAKKSTPSDKPGDRQIYTGVDQHICPHCKKKFANDGALTYHVDKFVCRKSEKPKSVDDEDESQGEKSSKKGRKQYKKFRGALEDRTCPKCEKVFTSVYGKSYHVKQGVCKKKDVKDFPFCSLQPGTLMVSPFGVVEVIKDDRAIPSPELPRNIGNMKRLYNNQKVRQEGILAKAQQLRSSKHLAFRRRLNRLRDRDQLTQESVRGVFFERSPLPELKDPSIPIGFHPDRIVECVLAQDNRPRFSGLEEKISKAYDAANVVPMKLFLTRRSLSKVYKQSSECLICPKCGRVFDSRPGCSYHLKANACSKASIDAKKKFSVRMELIEKGAKKVLEKERVRPRKIKLETSNEAEGVEEENQDSKHSTVTIKKEPQDESQSAQSKKFVDPRVTYRVLKEEFLSLQSKLIGPMYPSVHKALKYKKIMLRKRQRIKKETAKPVVIKRIIKKKRPRDPDKPSSKKRKKARKQDTAAVSSSNSVTDITAVGCENMEIDDTSAVQNTSSDQNYTSIPATNDFGGKMDGPATSGKTETDDAENAFADLPPIIDLRVLLAEVCVGRYPRMKPNGPDFKHDTLCKICKNPHPNRGSLQACGFCKNSIHFECLQTKFTVKAPEPEDEETFMCHNCIQYVLARRARAEKRRLEKQGDTVKDGRGTDKGVVPEAKSLIPGKEYDCVIAQAQQAADLVELLRDGKVRLDQQLYAINVGDARRDIISRLTEE